MLLDDQLVTPVKHRKPTTTSKPPIATRKFSSPSISATRIGPYLIGKTLGVGSTGHVKLGTHILTRQQVAIKIIPKQQLNDKKDVLRKKMEREITIMKLIQHPHVLQLHDVYESDTELLLILEHVQGGELFDYIVQRGRLSEAEALSFFQQIIFGVEYCHRHLIWYSLTCTVF
jgi:serine/threonine protein kinase